MNRDTRDRLLLPLLLPVGGLVVIALLVVGFSRILLSVTPTAATATAVTVALGILAVAVAVATRPMARFSNLLSMVTGVAGVALLAGGIALAAAGPKEEPAAGGEGGGGGQAAPVVALSASSGAAANGFDQTKLSAPADLAFVIRFDNQDPGVPHNIGLYRDEGYSQPIAKGDIITGPAQSDLAVDALPAGTYYFRCEIHPTTMTGQIEVGGTPGGGGAPNATVHITAQTLAFDLGEFTLPANTEATIVFENKDDAVPHNVAIYTDDTFATVLFKGQIFNGVATMEYAVPPLDPGTYVFRCDVHPNMTGAVTVA